MTSQYFGAPRWLLYTKICIKQITANTFMNWFQINGTALQFIHKDFIPLKKMPAISTP